ncbi:Holliday junction resolvase RuvX [Candidatus Chloroploca sp. M-50]|uniref:Putative pre-16S rRNA nuclease n=1 Tax=Candidatus Chloroploca mongolica TaxID=2528176 RepID=A0ABS4DH78_9CHLR|nr:Holliday junction resolvase RuvX [Candidatus Chloroploca mongolica]MBP1468811.1 Holliday junction resolvase RuvX [Candidatus Chloroploca mongolica]
MYLAEERIIGLDVGERRIGIALSDASRMLASPLTTIAAQPQPQALERIRQLVREYGVIELVVGLPLTLRGEVGPQAELVQKFATLLETTLGLPVRLVDERLTTAAADQMLRELGVKPDKRKLQIDQVAASIILQDYLDQQRTS